MASPQPTAMFATYRALRYNVYIKHSSIQIKDSILCETCSTIGKLHYICDLKFVEIKCRRRMKP